MASNVEKAVFAREKSKESVSGAPQRVGGKGFEVPGSMPLTRAVPDGGLELNLPDIALPATAAAPESAAVS